MIRSASRLILVLIAAAAIAISVGGFSWDDGNAVYFGSGAQQSVDSSGSATLVGFSWDD